MRALKKAELSARHFLTKYQLTSPLDLTKAGSILKIKVQLADLEGNSAILYRGKRSNLIIVNQNQILEQRRFNIAHEMAHILLKHQGKIFTSFAQKEQRKPLQEKCADVCASELLIPLTTLKRKAYEYHYDVQKLKGYFKVSEGALVTKMKIHKLNYKNTSYKHHHYL